MIAGRAGRALILPSKTARGQLKTNSSAYWPAPLTSTNTASVCGPSLTLDSGGSIRSKTTSPILNTLLLLLRCTAFSSHQGVLSNMHRACCATIRNKLERECVCVCVCAVCVCVLVSGCECVKNKEDVCPCASSILHKGNKLQNISFVIY